MQHTVLHSAEGFHCTVCNKRWRGQPDSVDGCPGAPVYVWDAWPKGMLTEKQMKAKRLIPGPLAGLIVYSKAADGSGYLKVYRESEATPKSALTEKQIAAVEKRKAAIKKRWTCANCGNGLGDQREYRAGVCYVCQEKWDRENDRAASIQLARSLLRRDDLVIWDSETTDLDGQFIEIGVVDICGRVLFDQRIRPQCLNSTGAYAVHGIRDDALATMPTFVEVYPALRQALHGKTWLIYSADFDVGRLRTSVSDWGFFSEFKHYFKQYPIKAADIYCMRDLYAAFCGEWHSYYKNYRWQKLTSAASGFGITSRKPAHSAIGDCLMTLDLLYAVADCYRNETL